MCGVCGVRFLLWLTHYVQFNRMKDLAIQNANIKSAKMDTRDFERGLEAALM